MEALALDEALGTAETVTLKKGLEAEALETLKIVALYEARTKK